MELRWRQPTIVSEMAFLRALCRARVTGAAALPQEEPDWDLVLLLAEAHQILPLVWQPHLQNRIPHTLVCTLARRQTMHTRRSLLFLSELRRIVQALDETGVASVSFKGPLLAIQLYGDCAQRDFTDLDLLVAPHDFTTASAVLSELGYTSQATEPSAGFHKYEQSLFIHRELGVPVELHRALMPKYFTSQPPAICLHLETVLGYPIRTLSRESNLIYLAAHGAKHAWSTLGWLADFAQMANVQGIDTNKVDTLSRVAGGSGPLQLAFSLAERVFSLHLNRRNVSSSSRIERLAARQADRLLSVPVRGASPWEQLRTGTAVAANSYRATRYAAAATFIPAEGDFASASLPRALWPLYYPIRIGRFAKRSVRNLVSGVLA
jgi:Uncharacterised nucleotidyltransferase